MNSVNSPVFPELITGRQDQFLETGWKIRAGWALRGHASCNFADRILEVPLGVTPIDRVIRAHELMHVRVSPHDVRPTDLYPEIQPRALECAEEFRVNELLARTGFAVEQLCDGSEVSSGLRLAANEAWDETVYFFVATLGTGAEREFLKGIRKVEPEWVKVLTLLRRRVRSLAASMTNEELGSTVRDLPDGRLPRGFELFTVPLARLMMTVADAQIPKDAERLRQLRRALEPGGRRPPTGRFAPLIFDETLVYEGHAVRMYARRARADVTGTAVRYPSRLLTDPQRRAFARPRRSLGGVVVVDQSGSMDLDPTALDDLLRLRPGATVVGYSHRPGDRSALSNAWVIARGGLRVRDIPVGNVGNGVDGPILRWAISQRRSGDPLIWVTDGQITDSNDHPGLTLARECAELVVRHRIQLVRTLSEAADCLVRRASWRTESPLDFGRVGREIGQTATVTASR